MISLSLATRAVIHAGIIVVPVLTIASPAKAYVFTPGDLVLSITSGTTSNLASAITLQEITSTGTRVGAFQLPQTTTIVNGVTQYAISGEYGSSSEGTLQRSADGKSLVIAGYGINANAFNTGGTAVFGPGATKNGSLALAQTTSVPGGPYTAVPRVVASIGAGGAVDTSTGLFNVFDGNNPRSVATVNGSTFYLGGQGAVNGVGTGGVIVAQKGASTATALDTSSDYRTAEIYNGKLYASRDYNGPSVKYTTIDGFAANLPTGVSAPTALTGIGPDIANLTLGQANNVNGSRVGNNTYLSPENFFFANDSTLYIADSGNPKSGNLGKAELGAGGLQKWVRGTNGAWTMQYDIYQGLNLVANSTTAAAATTGTSGLIGLTGQVIGDNVFLYATNSSLSDTGQTYVYEVTDSLANLNPTIGKAESFQTIFTADRGTIVRGIAFAPEDASINVPEPATMTLLAGMLGAAGLVRRRRCLAPRRR